MRTSSSVSSSSSGSERSASISSWVTSSRSSFNSRTSESVSGFKKFSVSSAGMSRGIVMVSSSGMGFDSDAAGRPSSRTTRSGAVLKFSTSPSRTAWEMRQSDTPTASDSLMTESSCFTLLSIGGAGDSSIFSSMKISFSSRFTAHSSGGSSFSSFGSCAPIRALISSWDSSSNSSSSSGAGRGVSPEAEFEFTNRSISSWEMSSISSSSFSIASGFFEASFPPDKFELMRLSISSWESSPKTPAGSSPFAELSCGSSTENDPISLSISSWEIKPSSSIIGSDIFLPLYLK